MSLFATDSSLMETAIGSWSPPLSAGLPADVLANLLPQLVADALLRGHVRSAAMTFEQAASLLPFDHPAMQTARQLLDHCAATDAALQQRQIAGEMVIIPSLTESAPSIPRFHVGVTETELAHPAVVAFLQAEQETGAQAELRNFLEQALLDADRYIDLDPGVGAGVLSALSLASGPVVAVPGDDTLRALLARNAPQVAGAERRSGSPVQFAADIAEACATVTAERAVIHLGDLPVSTIAMYAAAWHAYPIAFAWDASDASVAQYAQQELEQFGASSFVMAEDEEGLTLSPFREGRGATTAFALTESFIDSLGGA